MAGEMSLFLLSAKKFQGFGFYTVVFFKKPNYNPGVLVYQRAVIVN